MRNYLELMIDFIKPLFSSTKIVYSYNLPLEKVRTEIEAVFDDSTKFLSFTDMRAHFTSNDSFEIDAKLNAATKGVQYHSILYGRIEYGELNKTNIITEIQPAVSFKFLFWISIITCTYFIINGILNEIVSNVGVGIIVGILGPYLSIKLADVSSASVEERYQLFIDKRLNSIKSA